MSADEPRHERFLKKAQLWLAVLVGVTTLAVGVYNVQKLFFAEESGGEPGGVSLAVRSSQGKPVAQARVELLLGNVLVASALTDEKGSYEREGVAPGNYSLKVSQGGFEPELVTVSVPPGKMSHFNVVLRPAGSPVKSALEEVGAGWIRDIGKRKEEAPNEQQP